jgi:chromosome segregation ATPase
MTIEKFIGGIDQAASPIVKHDLSELDTLHLSLPDSFDESLCLDLYKDFRCQSRHEPKKEDGSRAARNVEKQECTPYRNDLEQKVQELLLINFELNEKSRRYDSLEKRSKENEAEIESLRSQLQQQLSLYDSSTVREKELDHQIVEYGRKIHLIGIDLEHARKESEVFLTRAEKAEKDREASDSTLKRSQQTYEKELLRIKAEREETKSRCEQEMSRLREGFNHEIASSRGHQNEAFTRESKLLCDARHQAIEQTKLLQHELSELRSDREKKEAENLDIIIELERQLADVRSDLKVKSCELNTLQACHDRTIAEATKSKDESIKCKEALALLQQECSRLERRADRSEEAIRLKDEELEVYRHDDLLVDCGFEDGASNGEDYFSGRRSLIKNSVALARKCRELQLTLKKLSGELGIEREKNEALSMREEANQQLFQELSVQSNKKASAYIISTVKARDTEILRLNSNITWLQMSLNKTTQERDDLSFKLATVLQRRDQLDEMKALVESMRNATMNSVSPRESDQRAAAGRSGADDDPENCEEDDLFEHMIHRSYMTLPGANSK